MIKVSRDRINVFKRSKSAVLGLIFVIITILTAIFAPLIAPYDPVEQNLIERLEGPSSKHWLGTDNFGRDIFSRIIWGSRVSLKVGLTSMSFGILVGFLLGIISGYYGGIMDALIMRLVDVLLAFPSILLALTIMAIMGSSVNNVILAIGITAIPRFTRIVRAEVISIKDQEYVTASQALGATNFRTMFKHIAPNVLTPLIIMGTLRIAYAIISEASLSFLGLGVQPPTPSWGNIISAGKGVLSFAPWISVSGGIAIVIAVLGFNLFGDGLRDALDPKSRRF